MKNIVIIFTLITALFMSCDGRQSQRESLEAAVTKFKDSVGTIEVIKYFPEEYSENVTDTILSNGYRVIIKTFSDMEHQVVQEFRKDTIVNKHYYRDYKSIVTIYKNDKEILSKNIDKSNLYNENLLEDDDLKNVILQGVSLNQADTQSEHLKIDIWFCKPETDDCLNFKLSVDSDGKYEIVNDDSQNY